MDLEKYRENGRININKAKEEQVIKFSDIEQRGARKNKFWFNNHKMMYKDIYPETYEDYAELIGYEFAKLLGMNCASYDLAIYNGNFGVITKSIVNEDRETMVSGSEIISTVYTDYILILFYLLNEFKNLLKKYNINNYSEYLLLDDNSKVEFSNDLIILVITTSIDCYENNSDISKDETIYKYFQLFEDVEMMYNEDFNPKKREKGILLTNNLYDLWSIIEIYSTMFKLKLDIEGFMNDLINMFIFDILTSHGDRHADNWSVIIDKNTNEIKLASTYDNSGIFCLNRKNGVPIIYERAIKLMDEKLSEPKRIRVTEMLAQSINSGAPGLKVEMNDVKNREKKENLIAKFINHSSDEILIKLEEIINRIDENAIENMFQNIEFKTKKEVPREVKLVVKTILQYNLNEIRGLLDKKGRIL